MIGQNISEWPVGAECHDPVQNVSYVYPTAHWLQPTLAAIGVVAIALTTVFNLTDRFKSRRRRSVVGPA